MIEREGEERQVNGSWTKWIYALFGMVALSSTVNMTASRWAADFGMTPPDLMKEFYAIVLYIILGIGLLFLIGRFKYLPKVIRFGLRLLVIVFAISICHNQVAISYELAPIKKEFNDVAAVCDLKPGGELECHGGIEKVIAKRQTKLAELNAVIYDDWQVKGSRVVNQVETSAIYFRSLF
ncbi:MAG: hypothetical protein NTW66_02510 [Candidatus Magasanikbacteria bacterium]|nr:hypothetical protein [Candidatus Magasanikbacteria bacterium]